MRRSLVMATRNRAPILRRTLESVLGHRYKDLEIIVIDDASSDDTWRVVRNTPVKYTRLEREGGWTKNPGRPYNIGLGQAVGDVVFEQDSAVVHVTPCLDQLMELLDEPGNFAFATVYDGEGAAAEAYIRENLEGLQSASSIKTRYPIVDGTCSACRGLWWLEHQHCPTVGPLTLYTGVERPAAFAFLGGMHRDDWLEYDELDDSELTTGNDQRLAERLKAKGILFGFHGQAIGWHQTHMKV